MSDVNNPSNFLPIKLSKKDFLQYKEELDKFFSTRKDAYKSLFESFDILKKKNLHLSYLLFSYYNSWIFPYISYTKITRGNIFSSSFEISLIFKKLSKNMNCPFDEKLFVLWYFYIYYNFFIKEKNTGENTLINQMRYILCETGKIVINLLEQKLLSIKSVINILDLNLFCLEYFMINSGFSQLPEKKQKLRKLIIFLNFFHLLKKTVIFSLKKNDGFENVLAYLDKIKNNSEIIDEKNIILLFNNNILQDFIQNILDNLNICELGKTIADIKNKLVAFYSHFLKNKYKSSKIYNILQDNLRHSFEHLYNFKQNKNLIIRDVFKIDFYSAIINKLFRNSDQENINSINDLNPINSSFYFETKNSGLSFESTKKLSLDQSTLFFSFRNNNLNIEENQEIPLLIIFRNNFKKAEKSIGLKIFLKKFEKDTFKLYFSQQKDHKDEHIKILNEDSDIIINNEQTYNIAINFGKKLKIFLLEASKNNLNKIIKKEIVLNHQISNEFFSFYLGKDDKGINFYKGLIGPLIIIKLPNKDNVDKHIEEIISLKENYKDFIIIKTDLSKNYNFISKNDFGNDFLKESKNVELIKYNSDGMLFLSPDFVKFYKNKMMYDENLISLENKNKKVPCIYECANQNQNCEFIITEFNISIYNEENFIKLLLADNCLNYFSLLFEYFSQLFRFYELKKEKDKIFEENEIKLVINYCIESIKNYLPISWKYKYPIYSDYTYKALKAMLNNLYNCILNMNKIEPIFIEIYNVLLDLNRGNKSFFSSSFMNEYDKNQKDLEQNDFKSKLDLERYNKNKYVKYNINLFIGIIDILLTPDFYNLKESKSYLLIIKKIFDEVFNDIKNNIKMIDLSLMKNIFYKLLSLIQLLTEIFSSNENEAKNEIILKENEDKQEDDMYQKLIKNIFEVIIVILKSKFNNNEDKNSVNDYLNKLFLFVFGSHIYNYDLVLNYLSIIDDLTSNLKFEENQIIELKNILFQFEKYKENKSNENKENIKAFENKIATIQSFIISKIYEYIFLDFNDKCPIKINFLEEFLKKNNISNIFVRIKSLLEKYFANIFKEESIINNLFLDMDYIKLNKYFKKIFEFLRFLLKILYSEELKDLKEIPQYLDFIYDLLYNTQKNMEIQEKNFEKCIIFLLNYIEFIHLSIYEGEKDSYNINFLYNEKKIVKIIEELYDRCVESTLIHCDYYFIIKDEKNLTSAVQEKKLILEILFDFYGNILLTVYHKYRKPEENKNKINEIYIAFVQGLNTFFEQKLISEFNADAYDIKNTPYLKKFKSIFFLSDFYKLAFHHNKYEKKYLKVKQLKDFSKQMNFYKKMQEIISKLKPDFIELNNQFNYFHTTYFFYQLCNLNNIKLIPFTNDEEIKKHKELKEILEKTQSSMKELKEIVISDHFKMNFICKEYYFKKRTTNDSDLKNMLKTIQVILFNKKLKNIDKKDLIQEIDKEFKTNEIKSRKSENSRGSSNSTGSNPKKTNTSSLGSKDSFDGSAPGSSSDIILEINRESNDFEISGVHNIKKDENITTQEKTEIKEVTINESFNDQIESLKRLIEESNTKNILENIDKYSIINPKKEFMKKIFGIYYSDAFFENDTFQKLKQLYLNTIITSNPDTKLLNYPSKIKNFSNGLEPCNFLKENDKFFITKILPITHHYFYEYMCKHNSLNDSIILLKSYLLNETKLEKEINNLNLNKFQCEIIKPDRIYYGQIINSVKEKFILFSSQHYELFDKKLASNEIVEQIKQRGFSFSVLKNLETDNTKKARKKAKNYLLDNDIYPEEEFNSDKKILIFYDDIEEIVERRILYSWQAFEIFLKNGKSYMINMLNKLNYDKIIDILKSNKNILFRDKDFLINKQEITNQWKIKKLPTYEYLLFINKFSSRSYNDITQYYIFPWILLDFSQINEIIKNEKGIFEFKRKHKIESILKKQKKEQEKKEKKEKKEGEKKVKKEKKEKKEKKDKKEITEEKIINLNSKQKSNEEILELVKKYRDLKYPVTAQGERQKQIKTEKYNDEEEKFAVHHGTHYSTGSYVEYYLMRNEPYTTLIVELQNYNQEDPNRLLLRIKDTINIINTGYDNRELIPELFSKIDYLVNVNCGFFGIKKNKELIDDIDFNMEKNPLTIYNNITYGSKFILLHKKILNSDTIALNLNNWIDNIFGIMQHPQQKKIAAKSLNIFPKSTYEQMNNLEEKLQKLSVKYKDDTPKLIKRFINKVNVIISFGQCPHVVFHEEHKNRDLIKLSTTNSEQENYGLQDDYQGADFIDTYVLEQLKNDNSDNTLKSHGIYFETNPQIEKEFILSSNSELIIVDTNFYNYNDPKKYSWNFFSDPIKLPSICLLKNIQTENNNNFYIYNVKYAFSSFPSDNTNNNNTKNKNNDKNKNKSSYYLYANKIINNIPKIFEEQAEKCKIITCRHIDNSFKLHFLTLKKKKLISIETYSYICEDFVMCCKAISNNSFIIALRNGKLIKAKLYEFINNNLEDKNKKKSGIEYEVTFDKYITGHIGSINVLEINERLGIVITGGDDNKIIIRKLYDFELLTSIKLKTKFIITMVKVSDNNLLYVICFNKRKEKNIIFGYSLSGLKFAKSEYSLFTNLDFTPGGNIVTLENNSKLAILYGYNLQKMDLNEKDEDYQKYNKMLKSFNEDNNNIGWIQFNNYKKYYGKDRSIISFTKENNNKNHIYQTLKVTNISYFD